MKRIEMTGAEIFKAQHSGMVFDAGPHGNRGKTLYSMPSAQEPLMLNLDLEMTAGVETPTAQKGRN